MAGAPSRGATPGKSGDLVTIAANGHGAPAAPMGPRSVTEKKPAPGIRTGAQARTRALDDDFRGRASDGGEKPVGAAFAGNKLQPPRTLSLEEFVMPFGNAENFVYRCDPLLDNPVPSDRRAERSAQGIAQTNGPPKHSIGGLRIRLGKSEECRAALRGNNPRDLQEKHEFLPGQTGKGRCRIGRSVGKVDGEAATQQG